MSATSSHQLPRPPAEVVSKLYGALGVPNGKEAVRTVVQQSVQLHPAVEEGAESLFVARLRDELMLDVSVEVEKTLRVAVCSAAGVPRAKIPEMVTNASITLSDVEVKMCFVRLKQVAERWRAE